MSLLNALAASGIRPELEQDQSIEEWMDENLSERMIERTYARVRAAQIHIEVAQCFAEDVHPMEAERNFERMLWLDEQSEKHFNNRPPY